MILKQSKNSVAMILQIIGFVTLLIGFIGYLDGEDFLLLGISFVIAMFFFGFAEVINLLQKIYKELKTDADDQEETTLSKNTDVSNRDPNFFTIVPLTDSEKEQVYALFQPTKKRNITIINTPFKNYCIVSVADKNSVVHVQDTPAIIKGNELSSIPELVKWATDRKGIKLIDKIPNEN